MSQSETSNQPDDAEPDLDRVVEQLRSEEGHAQETALGSYESLQFWLQTHPGLQQPGIYDMINTYGPALLQIVRRMLGL